VFDPGLIHVKELWSDQAALDRHFAGPLGQISESTIAICASTMSVSREKPDLATC
jgi:quinol monooxygenase YgiN